LIPRKIALEPSFGMPRVGLRASRAKALAPSTPGRLGYYCIEQMEGIGAFALQDDLDAGGL